MLHMKRPIRLAAAVVVIAALGATAACSGASTGGQAVPTGQSAAAYHLGGAGAGGRRDRVPRAG